MVKMVKDPTCMMEVDAKTAINVEYKGQKYYFCCKECKGEFINTHPPYPTHCSECMKPCEAEETIWKLKHKGEIYIFCSEKCKKKFEIKTFEEVIY